MSESLRTFNFSAGNHTTREQGLCVMEAVAMLAGEEHTDHPKCADNVITKIAIRLNDICSDEWRNQHLQGLPYRIVGTNVGPGMTRRRMFRAADWAVREVTPIAFRETGFHAEAAKLEVLSPIVDEQSAADVKISCAGYSAAACAGYSAAACAYYAEQAAAACAGYSAAACACYAEQAAAACAAQAAAAYAARAAHAVHVVHVVRAVSGVVDIERVWLAMLSLLDELIRMSEPVERVPAEAGVVAFCADGQSRRS